MGKKKANFAFNVKKSEDSGIQGETQFRLNKNVNFHSASITRFSVSGNCALWSGTGTFQKQSGIIAFTAEACDNGKPGSDDTFEISIGGSTYSGSLINGGSIQLHGRRLRFLRNRNL